VKALTTRPILRNRLENCAFGSLAQVRLQFEGQFNRIEARGVVRQAKQRGAAASIASAAPASLKIVRGSDVAARECWNKTLLHLRKEHRPIDGGLCATPVTQRKRLSSQPSRRERAE
jgi:hypothetical protein